MLIGSLMFLGGCAKPPTKEIENAEKAVAEAKQKEADLYAKDVFAKAEDVLKKAKDFVAVKKYTEAKKAAENALGFAQQAIAMVEPNKAKLKEEAEQKYRDAQAVLNEVKSLFAKVPKKKSPVNREEIQNMIKKWESDLANIGEQLQAQKIRQAYDQLLPMQEQITSQKEGLVAVLEKKQAVKK
jgi:hypothetical protein